MHTQTDLRDIKIVPIGNSKGIRLPKALLQKYGIEEVAVLEETSEGLLLHKKNEQKLSWSHTYQAMAKASEDWSDFDDCIDDGLEE